MLSSLPCLEGHTAVPVGQSSIVVFGGKVGPGLLNPCTYTLDLRSMAWRVLLCRGDVVPAPRAYHSATMYAGRMIVFGGLLALGVNDIHYNTYNVYVCSDSLDAATLSMQGKNRLKHPKDVRALTQQKMEVACYYELDLLSEEATWRMPSSTGAIPQPRSNHAAAVYQSTYLIYGGYSVHSTLKPDDPASASLLTVYSLNLETYVWSQVPIRTGIPPNVWGFSAVMVVDILLLFGGVDRDTSTELNALCAFHFSRKEWRSVTFRDSAAPNPRMLHSSVLVGSTMVTFGGSTNTRCLEFNDTHFFDLSSGAWIRCHPTGDAPSARSGHAAVAVGETMYVVGGLESGLRGSNDTYALHVPTSTWRRVASPMIDQDPVRSVVDRNSQNVSDRLKNYHDSVQRTRKASGSQLPPPMQQPQVQPQTYQQQPQQQYSSTVSTTFQPSATSSIVPPGFMNPTPPDMSSMMMKHNNTSTQSANGNPNWMTMDGVSPQQQVQPVVRVPVTPSVSHFSLNAFQHRMKNKFIQTPLWNVAAPVPMSHEAGSVIDDTREARDDPLITRNVVRPKGTTHHYNLTDAEEEGESFVGNSPAVKLPKDTNQNVPLEQHCAGDAYITSITEVALADEIRLCEKRALEMISAKANVPLPNANAAPPTPNQSFDPMFNSSVYSPSRPARAVDRTPQHEYDIMRNRWDSSTNVMELHSTPTTISTHNNPMSPKLSHFHPPAKTHYVSPSLVRLGLTSHLTVQNRNPLAQLEQPKKSVFVSGPITAGYASTINVTPVSPPPTHPPLSGTRYQHPLLDTNTKMELPSFDEWDPAAVKLMNSAPPPQEGPSPSATRKLLDTLYMGKSPSGTSVGSTPLPPPSDGTPSTTTRGGGVGGGFATPQSALPRRVFTTPTGNIPIPVDATPPVPRVKFQ
eukprot:PhF_6_TR16982/c0_g1_i2/m.25677